MQPHREIIDPDPGATSRWVRWRTSDLGWYWHCHSEVEIVAHLAGRGERQVGDHRATSCPGQILLLGSDLPHAWGGSGLHDLVSLQFRADLLLNRFSGTPESSDLERVLRAAGRGLLLDGMPARHLGQLLLAQQHTRGLERMVAVLRAVLAFQVVADRPLAGPLWDRNSADRHPVVDTLCSWMSEHANEPISLAEAAHFVGMNPSALGRLFRRHTGHSVLAWINRLRIGSAIERLRDSDQTISSIAFATGFSNLANFNRTFRHFTNQTPRSYRNTFRDLATQRR